MPDCETIDFIVPAYNEAEGIGKTCERLLAVFDKLGLHGSIIFIDDGSDDDTWQILKTQAEKDLRIKLLRFSRNFGHQVAIVAGLTRSKADYNLILDSDLQDPPELVDRMMSLAKQGYDVVYGVRESRQGETAMKKMTAKLFYRLLNIFSPYSIPLDAGDFRLVSAKARSLFLQADETARLNREIWSWVGLKQIGFAYHRPSRVFGKSKYNWKRMLKLAFDGFAASGAAPVLAVAVAAGGLFLLSGLFLIFSAPVYSTVTFSSALVLAAIAIAGFYIARLYTQSRRRPDYLISEIIGTNNGNNQV
jgi:glycosyltransferase involved in cell wall biosynthesis